MVVAVATRRPATMADSVLRQHQAAVAVLLLQRAAAAVAAHLLRQAVATAAVVHLLLRAVAAHQPLEALRNPLQALTALRTTPAMQPRVAIPLNLCSQN